MKKKIIAMCLVVALAVVAIGGATLAYFTDTDEAVNVMTLGNVDIEQIEQERGANGALQPFTQGQTLLPMGGDPAWAPDMVTVNGDSFKVFDSENVMDKIVTVNNNGTAPAYVRTIVALEAGKTEKEAAKLWAENIAITDNSDGTTILCEDTGLYVEIDGTFYIIVVYTYADALEGGAKSAASLTGVALYSKTTQQDVATFGGNYEVLVLSQAVQAADMGNDAGAALDKAFGDVNTDNVQKWFKNLAPIVAKPASGATRPAGYNPVDEGTNVVKSVTVFDNSDKDTNLRALYTGDGKKVEGNLDVIDCYLDGTYAMNVIGDDTGVLTVEGTDLRGWVSYDGFTSATFTNCTFGENSNPEIYNNVRPYSDVTFTNCAFDGTTFWLDKVPAGEKVTFVNCTMDGVAITAASQLTVGQGTADSVVIG